MLEAHVGIGHIVRNNEVAVLSLTLLDGGRHEVGRFRGEAHENLPSAVTLTELRQDIHRGNQFNGGNSLRLLHLVRDGCHREVSHRGRHNHRGRALTASHDGVMHVGRAADANDIDHPGNVKSNRC